MSMLTVHILSVNNLLFRESIQYFWKVCTQTKKSIFRNLRVHFHADPNFLGIDRKSTQLPLKWCHKMKNRFRH